MKHPTTTSSTYRLAVTQQNWDSRKKDAKTSDDLHQSLPKLLL